MTISIRESFKSVSSERYQKPNIYAFATILIIISAIMLMFPTEGEFPKILFGIAYMVISLAFYIIQSGYYAIASNKEICQEQDVFPSVNSIDKIFIEGSKFLIGTFGLWIAAYIIPAIIIFISAFLFMAAPGEKSFFLYGIILILFALIITFIISYFWVIPLVLCYFRTLNLKDLFNVQQASEFRNAIKQDYFTFVYKIFIMSCILYLISIVFMVLIFIAFHSYFTSMNKQLMQDNISIISTAFAILYTIYVPSLIGQTVKSIINNNEKNII